MDERDQTSSQIPEDVSRASMAPATPARFNAKEYLASIKEAKRETEAAKDVKAREEVVVLKKYCAHLAGSDCERCVLACPHDAVTLTETTLEIDKNACTRCGICIGICDAFTSKRVTLLDLAERAKTLVTDHDPLYFTCAEQLFPGFVPHTNVIVTPCLAALPPEFWAYVLALTKNVYLFCDRTYCDDCACAGPLAKQLFDHALDSAQAWSNTSVLFADKLPEKETLINKYAAMGSEDNYDRRKMLREFAFEMGDIATGKHRKKNSKAVQDFLERKERMRALGAVRSEENPHLQQTLRSLHAGVKKKTLWPRRELLLRALHQKPSMVNNVELYVTGTDDSTCTRCQKCVEACPTGARSYNKEYNCIEVDPAYCIICGICVKVCPANACDYCQISAEELLHKEGTHYG